MAGCLTTATSGSDETSTATPDDPTATVEVGPDGDLVFEPARLEVPPGATVEWVWKSDNHNVVVVDQPNEADWNGSPGSKSEIYDAGYRFSHTFDTLGPYEYYCQPHRSAGMIGEVEVTESPATTATRSEDTHTETNGDEETSTDEPATVVDKTGQNQVTVEVGPNGSLEFDPEAFKISPDTSVTWTWKTDNHNIVTENIPADAAWSGTPGGPTQTYHKGYTYEKTFSVSGEYTYYCEPHKTADMAGRFIVE